MCCKSRKSLNADSIFFLPDNRHELLAAGYSQHSPNNNNSYPFYLRKIINDTSVYFLFPFDDKTFTKSIEFKYKLIDSVGLSRRLQSCDKLLSSSSKHITITFGGKTVSYDIHRYEGGVSLGYGIYPSEGSDDKAGAAPPEINPVSR